MLFIVRYCSCLPQYILYKLRSLDSQLYLEDIYIQSDLSDFFQLSCMMKAMMKDPAEGAPGTDVYHY